MKWNNPQFMFSCGKLFIMLIREIHVIGNQSRRRKHVEKPANFAGCRPLLKPLHRNLYYNGKNNFCFQFSQKTSLTKDKPLCSRFHLIKLSPEVVHCLPHVHQSHMLISKVSLFLLVTSLYLFSCFVPISSQLLDIERKLLIGWGCLF